MGAITKTRKQSIAPSPVVHLFGGVGVHKLAVGDAKVTQAVDWVFGRLILAALGGVLLQRVDEVLAAVANVQLWGVQRR